MSTPQSWTLFLTDSRGATAPEAALARGMDIDVKRTSYEDVKLRAADYITMLVFTVLAAAIVVPVLTKGAAGI